MHTVRIFTFWEPRRKILPYLELCRKTWEINLPGYDIITLDYENLHDYIDPSVFDFGLLKTLSLPMQKDAISIAVLKQHGGVFIDMDTLILADISPIIRHLEKAEVLMFRAYMAFIAARKNARLLNLWLARIQKNIAALAELNKEEINWDYIGNSTLAAARRELARSLWFERLMQLLFSDACSPHSCSRREVSRGQKRLKTFQRKRTSVYFLTVLKKYLTALDSEAPGFILEGDPNGLSLVENYQKYWFEPAKELAIRKPRPPLIVALHNSWTPAWYKEMSQHEVLQHDCRLSQTLAYIINESAAGGPD